MSTDTPAPAFSPALRTATIILAIVETLAALSGVTVFGRLSEYGNSFAQWLMFIGLAIFPVLAIIALVFAIKGNIPRAIMAMAAIVIVQFLTDYLPGMFIHGLEFLHGNLGSNLYLFAQTVLIPILAVVSFELARRHQRLWLALALASLSTVANIGGVIAFGIGVMIYGF